MCQHQEQAFDRACAIGASAEVGGEPAFGTAEHAFCLPTLAVFVLGKIALHLAAVRAAGLRVGMPAVINRNDGFANPPLFVAASMVLFGIVGSVGHESSNPNAAHRFLDNRQEAGRVVAGAAADRGREDKMAAIIDDRRELRPPAMRGAAARTATSIEEVATHIVVFQARGIDRGFAAGREQTQLLGATNDRS